MSDRRYSTQTTALILVDVLNDFLADDGKLAGQIGPMIKKLNLKAHLPLKPSMPPTFKVRSPDAPTTLS